MMKNRAKVIKKIEICKQMPILLSINKNYFHYSNISNHLLYSIASTLSSLLLKTCSTTQNTIFKLTLLHISRKSSIFAAVLKVSDFVWCFQRLVFTYKTGVYTLWSWCSKFAVSNKFQPKQSNMDAMKNVFMQHIVCPWRTNLCAVFQTRNAIEPIVGYAGEGSYRFPTGSSLIGRDRNRKEAPRTER